MFISKFSFNLQPRSVFFYWALMTISTHTLRARAREWEGATVAHKKYVGLVLLCLTVKVLNFNLMHLTFMLPTEPTSQVQLISKATESEKKNTEGIPLQFTSHKVKINMSQDFWTEFSISKWPTFENCTHTSSRRMNVKSARFFCSLLLKLTYVLMNDSDVFSMVLHLPSVCVCFLCYRYFSINDMLRWRWYAVEMPFVLFHINGTGRLACVYSSYSGLKRAFLTVVSTDEHLTLISMYTKQINLSE